MPPRRHCNPLPLPIVYPPLLQELAVEQPAWADGTIDGTPNSDTAAANAKITYTAFRLNVLSISIYLHKGLG